MKAHLSSVVSSILFVMIVTLAIEANAVTITYVNTGPTDSRIFVGFDNNSSGYTTNDFISDPAAFSRADTAYGPLPPVGQLPAFDARTDARAELGTNLNNPIGTGIRSIFSPITTSFNVLAHGETYAGTGSYSSHSYVHSGDTTSTTPTHWIINVDPSGSEVAGTPTDVTVTGSISGLLSVAGASIADASWNVVTTSHGTIMSGSANQSSTGTSLISDTGTLIFTIPLGSTFELLLDYDFSTSGSGAGANSTSEISASLVEVSAQIQTPGPVPVLLSAVAPVIIWPPRPISVPLISSFAIDNPDDIGYQIFARVFTNKQIFQQEPLTEDILVPARRYPKGKGRFYLVLLSLVDENKNVDQLAVIGGLIPHDNSKRALRNIQIRAKHALNRVNRALKKTDIMTIDPRKVRLHEYGY